RVDVTPATLYLEEQSISNASVKEIKQHASHPHVMYLKVVPSGRHMWRQHHAGLQRIDFEAEQSAHQRSNDHRRRPDLVRRAGGELSVIVAREHFSHAPRGAVVRE